MIRLILRHIGRNIGLFILFGLIFTFSARSASPPAWWKQAETDARQDGYTLIDQDELKAHYADYRILDVRPDYEYADGHLPSAVNLEFDLADRLELKPEKQNALKRILGTDKVKPIVIYCRSYT